MAAGKYFSFQIKVLIPVVTLLVLILAIATWLIDQRFQTQVEEEARRRLATAEGVFHNSLEIRSRNLVLRYQNVVNEPRFKAVAQLGESKTMTAQLQELLDEMGEDVEVILFTTDQGVLLAGAHRDPVMTLERFNTGSAESIAQALQGRAVSDTVAVGEHLFSVVSAPVMVNDAPLGALTIGVRIDETAAKELKSLARGEIVFLANGQVVASTLRDPALYPRVTAAFERLISNQPQNVPGRMEQMSISNGEEFICLAGTFGNNPKGRLGYLLLSSIQDELRVLKNTQRTLWALSLSGILIGSMLITFLIRRVTDPLRRLRDSAEAVGRGDFSRRVEVESNDECGELATVFNQMTESLSASRAQADQALQTLKSTQAQLVQTEKLSAIGEFVSGIAHELNNPLTAVIGFSELLQESVVKESQKKFVDRIMQSADRCHKIVQNLLSFARQHPPERKWVYVNKLVEAAVEILSYETRTSNIEVVTHLSSELPRLLVDPHQMQQVFLNIINNARQALEHQTDGRIEITTQVFDQRVRIVFADNGPGIAPESLRRVFDPFFTTKPVGVGTGLGLSLSYGIIREHGGTITAQSQQGHGATFVVELPITLRGAESPAEKGAIVAAADSREHEGKRILVIDDEESVLELLREALSQRGYRVDTAREGESAMHHFGKENYDVIVCDWKIPGLSGAQIFEKFRETESEIARRFIFITGDVLNSKAEDFLRKHGTPCLLKPFSMEEFFVAIRKTFGSPQSHKDH